MTDEKQIDVGRALDKFFAIVRQEAMGNPRFAKELAEALGYEVVFRGTEALVALDPVLAAKQGEEAFKSSLLTFKAADLKKVAKAHGLATELDLKVAKNDVTQIVNLMWLGARSKIRDRGL